MAHEARHRVTGQRDPVPTALPPELAHPVDAEVRLEHVPDLDHHRRLALNRPEADPAEDSIRGNPDPVMELR